MGAVNEFSMITWVKTLVSDISQVCCLNIEKALKIAKGDC